MFTRIIIIIQSATTATAELSELKTRFFQIEQGTGTKSVKLIQFDTSKIGHHFQREQIKLS